jgi:hypothetical protein
MGHVALPHQKSRRMNHYHSIADTPILVFFFPVYYTVSVLALLDEM